MKTLVPEIQTNPIHIDDLWHHYGSKQRPIWSLKSINIDLRKGELLGLLGPSGCGKTTLLRLIAGFEKPCKGNIFFQGKMIASSTQFVDPENRSIGMVFQDYALFPHLNTWDNICFGLKKPFNSDRIIWLIELLGLTNFIKRYPHELSGGQRQRLALARALAPGNSLVLLDEPFCSLDVEVRSRLRNELPDILNSCNASGILVTHDPQEALAICDRIAVISEGELHQCSKPLEIVQAPKSPFVSKFVLNRNILPIQVNEYNINTPIGSIPKPNNLKTHQKSELIFDENCLIIKGDPSGNAIIKGKEFQGEHWIMRAMVDNLIVRIKVTLDSELQIGDMCTLMFDDDKYGLIFPGAISCKLFN